MAAGILPILAWGAGLALAGCQATGSPEAAAQDPSAERESVYFVRRGWHTDVGFPAASLEADGLGQIEGDLPGARILVFGFGDRHYVLAGDKNFLEMLRALLPGAGLVLVTGLISSPQAAFGADGVVELRVDAGQARRMREFVWRSLTRVTGGGLRAYARGPYAGSLFYAAVPRYSAFYTCNTWIADVLHAGGLPVSSTGVLFAAQVERQVEDLSPGP